MPTYIYKCPDCNYHMEIFHSMKHEITKFCPRCGTTKIIKQISGGAGVIFKGSGFYQTDYRSKKYESDKKREEG